MMINIRQSIKNARKSQDGKALIENFMSLSILQAVSYVFPLITLPYLARVIGVNKFGEIAFANSIEIYFAAVIVYGFKYTAVRDIAQCRDDINKVSEIFCAVFTAQILLFTIASILYIICIYSIPVFYEYRIILWATYPIMFTKFIFPDWMFQALEKMKFITILNLASNTLFTGLIFLVIKEEKDYFFYPILMSIGSIIAGFISLYVIVFKFKIKIFVPRFSVIYSTLKKSTDMFLSNIVIYLFQSMPVTILTSYNGALAAGLYSAGQKLYLIIENISNVFSRTFFPFLSRKKNKHHYYSRLSCAVHLCFCLLMFVFADLFIKLFFTPEFSESATIIRILSICPFFRFLYDTYGINYLVIYNKTNIFRKITFYCAVGGLLLSIILIPLYSYIAVAIVFVASLGAIGILSYIFARKLMASAV
jgi:PST family polysaccharide transporter